MEYSDMLTRGRLFHIPTLFLATVFGIFILGGLPRPVFAADNCFCTGNLQTSRNDVPACQDFCRQNKQQFVSFGEATPSEKQTIELKNPLGKTSTFEMVLDSITKFLVQIGAAIVVIMVLVAGFLYMTAGGNAEKVSTAHKTLTYALVGYAIILIASGLVIVLQKILGG